MYSRKEKSNENRNKAAANYPVHKKGDGNGSFEFVDNRPDSIVKKEVKSKIENDVIQGAWVGRRPLAIPLIGDGVDDAEHEESHGRFHEHIFYEDGGKPANKGFHDNALFEETDGGLLGQYKNHTGGYEDNAMRWAVSVEKNPGKYDLVSNNCQHWVKKVLKTYAMFDEQTPHGDRTGLLSGEKKNKEYW